MGTITGLATRACTAVKPLARITALVAVVFAMICAVPAGAQGTPNNATSAESTSHAAFKFHYRVNESRVDTVFVPNADIVTAIHNFKKTTEGAAIDSISVVGYSSPDGPYDLNVRLSRQRAAKLADWMQKELGATGAKLSSEGAGIDWSTFKAIVIDSDNIPSRNLILDALSSVNESGPETSRTSDNRVKKLMNIDGGDTW